MHFRHVKKVFVNGPSDTIRDAALLTTSKCCDKGVLRSSPPTRLTSLSPRDEVWWSKDEVFGFPRTAFLSRVKSSASQDGHPENSILSNIFTQLITRKYFQVAQTGLSYTTSVGVDGINLAVI